MVIDTSAIIAILFGAPDQRRYDQAIETATIRLISAVSRVEIAMVVEGRKGVPGRDVMDRFFSLANLDVVAVTPQHAERAIDAFRRFGKGRHQAGLNIGDCFSYALAAATGLPLLFKGDDFRHTDLISAL